MIINEEGTYTLRYTATDSCGKTTEVERELVVADNSPRRTVLYTDGTLIINEKQTDEAHNVELHGAATNVYVPFDPNGATDVDRYVFASGSDVPWSSERLSVLNVEIGTEIHPSSTAYWFSSLSNCTGIDVTNLDTSEVTTMNSMFFNSVSITTLDLSGLDTSEVTDMYTMFNGCSALTNLNITSFNTSKVTTMHGMFNGCSALTSLNLANFNTGEVTDMYTMFNNCSALTSLNVTSFNTGKVTDMLGMFKNCRALTNLDVTSFNTGKVTNMQSMFENCQILSSIDASGFDTSLVTNMGSMFKNCYAIRTIYASVNFVVDQVTTSSNMFYYCNNITGGAGTTYNSSYINKAMAKIDGGISNPGYFTAKS